MGAMESCRRFVTEEQWEQQGDPNEWKGKKTKDEFHFKETRYKNRQIYETSYLDGNQENLKLEIFKDKKDKEIFWFEKPLVTTLFIYKRYIIAHFDIYPKLDI